MTKRKAMLLAAGLVASLLGGAFAMALGLSGGGSAVADTPKRLDPIVKVRERTVKVEKKAKGGQAVQVVNLGSGPSQSQVGGDDDSGFEDHGSEEYEDEDHGSEEYEDEDHASEDHEDEDHASEDHEVEAEDD